MGAYQVKRKDGTLVPHDENQWHNFLIKLSDDFKDVAFYAPGIGGNENGEPCYQINIDSDVVLPELASSLPQEFDGVEIIYEFKKKGQARTLPLLITPEVK